MKRLQAFKFQIEQIRAMRQYAGNARKIWNLALNRYRKSRGILGLAKNITVSCVAGRWYASVQTEREVGQPLHPSTSIVGLDAGITLFATLSDGTMFEPVNALRTRNDFLHKPSNIISNRNPPERLRDGSMPCLSAVGIPILQGGEDVKGER